MVVCLYCNKSFDTHQSLREHASEMHPDSDSTDSAEDTNSSIWSELLDEVIEENEEICDDNGDIKTSKVIKCVRDKVWDWLGTANRIHDSTTYQKIKQEENRLRNQGYKPAEAIQAAWENRKFLLKELFKKKIEDRKD